MNPDLKIEETGTALVVVTITRRADAWMRKAFGEPISPSIWHLRPDGKDAFLAQVPDQYQVWQ